MIWQQAGGYGKKPDTNEQSERDAEKSGEIGKR
jgi:hypothetical protein